MTTKLKIHGHDRTCMVSSDIQRVLAGGRKILRGNVMNRKGKQFPQAGDVHSTLTEKIHSLRIAASEGQIRSMVQGHDESIR